MFIIIFHHVTTWHVMLGCYLKISIFFLKNSQNVLVWCKTCRKDTILKRNSKICSFVKCSFNVRWPSTMKKCVCVYLCHQSVMSHSRELRLLLMNGGTTVWAWRQYLVLCSRFFRTSFLEQQDISNNSCRLDTRTISHLTRINVSVCVCICACVCVPLLHCCVWERSCRTDFCGSCEPDVVKVSHEPSSPGLWRWPSGLENWSWLQTEALQFSNDWLIDDWPF